jgi:hypothetical protein
MSTIAEAMALADSRFAEFFFLFSRGRASSGEPLYGFALFPPTLDAVDQPPIIEAQHDDPVECIRMAIEAFDAKCN